MSKFADYLKKEKIIEDFIDIYKYRKVSEKNKLLLKKIVNNIYKLDNFEDNLDNSDELNYNPLNVDIFGNIYEKTLNHDERKALGEFYTPISVVNYILKAVEYSAKNDIENKKLIDISCGAGSFIVQAVKKLVERYKKIFKCKNLSELTLEEAKSIVLGVKENIYGIDINPIACILCQINMHHELFGVFSVLRKSEKDFRLPHFNIKNSNAFMLKDAEKYDYVVGNPPYLFIRDISSDQRHLIENSNFKTGKGQYDYYQIFIELGIKLLKNHGFLGYIVPDSILALSNRSIIRKYIYNTTKIKEIFHTGPKFDEPVVSNIILVLQKENEKLEREQNNIRTKVSHQIENLIPQITLKKWDHKFLIHLNETDILIIDYLNHHFPKIYDLNEKKGFKIKINRGVELTKTGEIIFCKKCEKFLPIPKKRLICPDCNALLKDENIETIIYETIPKYRKYDFKLFLYSINRYKVKEYKYIDIIKDGINYKKLDIYEDRIVIRQLSQNNLICATYDKKLSLTSQSFYNLKIAKSPIREFNHKYLLGIINSKLLSYYFIKSFGSYKKLFPRILIEKIKNLPIKLPENEKEKDLASKISEKVEILLNNSGNIVNQTDKIQKEVDRLVFNLYKIPNSNIQYILRFMKNLETPTNKYNSH